MEEKKMMPCSFIAGILFVVIAVLDLFLNGNIMVKMLCLVAYAAFTSLLFLRKREKYVLIPAAVLTLLMAMNFILGFKYRNYLIYDYIDGEFIYTFSIFAVICYLLIPIAYACMLGVMMTGFKSQTQERKTKLWLLPAVVIGVRIILGVVGGPMRLVYYYFTSLLIDLLTAAAFIFTALWALYPERDRSIMSAGKPTARPAGTNNTASVGGTTNAASVVNDEAYCDLIKHVLLLLFTFGVWYFIWIYRMTGYTNTVRDEEERNPTNKLLLCLFVPFYGIYWTYKTAQRVDKIAAEKNATSDLATLCLVLDIFVPIIPPILMQDKINKVITAGDVQKESKTVRSEAKKEETEVGSADEIKKFKELLDMGAITQEEFDAKKKQLLGL